MERWHDKVAVVTGASSGIGAAIALELVQQGLQVIGLARRLDKLEAIRNQLPEEKQSRFTPLTCYVCDAECVNATYKTIIEKFGGVDVLINCAGTTAWGQLLTMEVQELQQILQTNVMGIVHCTQKAFQSMRERNVAGHVFVINSVLGHKVFHNKPLPDLNMYCPSKYAVTAMTEILRQEFRGLDTKIKITSISPGLVATEMIPEQLKTAVGDCILEPKDVAAAIMYALSTPPHVQVHEIILKPLGEAV
ncbi:farnesol dehydrogenase [Stomoxys calcitrans]|uniref:farnesol dehydrogenase n=1 Tax=Stomoxys calcitrans TaxID=35570 RepID=UPI0027E22866|nr:farnesol dehydrogenase [Stomoxys calcitrans]